MQFHFRYTAYNRNMKEYTGEFTLTADSEDAAYYLAEQSVRSKWGSDLTILGNITESEEESA